MTQKVTVVGAGLAGSECALQLASRGVSVELIEQRPVVSSPAHHTDMFAELVCSNSLKSTKEDSAAGILKSELKKMGSFLLRNCRRKLLFLQAARLRLIEKSFQRLLLSRSEIIQTSR